MQTIAKRNYKKSKSDQKQRNRHNLEVVSIAKDNTSMFEAVKQINKRTFENPFVFNQHGHSITSTQGIEVEPQYLDYSV